HTPARHNLSVTRPPGAPMLPALSGVMPGSSAASSALPSPRLAAVAGGAAGDPSASAEAAAASNVAAHAAAAALPVDALHVQSPTSSPSAGGARGSPLSPAPRSASRRRTEAKEQSQVLGSPLAAGGGGSVSRLNAHRLLELEESLLEHSASLQRKDEYIAG